MKRRFATKHIAISKGAFGFLIGALLLVPAGAGAAEPEAGDPNVWRDLKLVCGNEGELLWVGNRTEWAVALGQDASSGAASGCHSGGRCGQGGRSAWDIVSGSFMGMINDGLSAIEKWNDDEPEARKADKGAVKRQVRRAQCTLPQCQKANSDKAVKAPPAPPPVLQPGQIRLEYPFRGPNQDRTGVYDRKVLETTIRHAVAVGVDPYLALAILFLENSPAVTNEGFAAYAAKKGLIPVDQFAAFDQLGCLDTGAGPDKFPNLTDAQVKEYRTLHANLAAAEAERKKATPALEKFQKAKQELVAHRQALKDYQEQNKPGLIKKLKALVGGTSAKSADKKLAELKANVASAEKEFEKQRKNGGEEAEKIKTKYDLNSAAETRFRTRIAKSAGDKAQLVLEELTCAGEPTKCYMLLQQQKKIPMMDLSFLDAEDGRGSDTETEYLCVDADRVDVGKEPRFLREGGNPGCCVRVTYPSELKNGFPKHIKTRLGADFLRKQVQSCVAGKKSPETLTYCIQKFHGLGGFGTTEKVDNKCLGGLLMSDRPVYGARAADLMANLFMSNPEIRSMVEHVKKVEDHPVISAFCLKSGPTTLEKPATIQYHWFLNEQKEYLLRGAKDEHAEKDAPKTLERPDQRAFKIRLEGDGGPKFRTPANEQELLHYLETEETRAAACKTIYWPEKKPAKPRSRVPAHS